MQFGSTINPALGRTDYSAYTKGAAQGAQAIGQGMQQLGQGIGIAIREYKKKEEEKEQDAYIADILAKNPELAKQLGADPADKKMLAHVTKAVGRENVIKGISSYTQQKEVEAKDGRVGSLARALVGGVEVPQDFLANMKGDEVMKAQGMAQGYRANEATINKTNADADALGRKQGKQSFATPEAANTEATRMAAGNPNLVATSSYSPEAGGYIPEVKVLPAKQIEDKYDSTIAKNRVERDQSVYDAAISAPEQITKSRELREMVKTGNINTGVASEFSQFVSKISSSFSPEQAAKASKTEIVNAFLGKSMLDERAKQKITSTMMNTPGELDFYKGILAGTTKMEPASLDKLAQMREEVAIGAIETHNRMLKKGVLDKFYIGMGMEKEEIQVPTVNQATDQGIPSSNAIQAEIARRKASKVN